MRSLTKLTIWRTVSEVPCLADPAEEFKEQCWEHILRSGETEIRNADQAEQYFSEHALDPGHVTLGDTVPGLLNG